MKKLIRFGHDPDSDRAWRRHTVRWLLALVTLIVFVSALGGCRIFGWGNAARGEITLFIDAQVFAQSTIEPPELGVSVADYHVTVSGAGTTVNDTLSPEDTTATFSELETGDWNVAVHARNADGVIIAGDETKVTVEARQTAVANVTMAYLTGEGTLGVTLRWAAALIAEPSIHAVLTPVDGSPSEDISSLFAIDAAADPNTAVYSGSWPAGSYSLSISLRDGGLTAWSRVYAVWVVEGQLSNAEHVLGEADLIADGGIELNIDPNQNPPYEVTLNGVEDVIAPEQLMTVELSLDPSSAPDSIRWYINGVEQPGSTGSSITVGPGNIELGAGTYWIDVLVLKNDRLSSGGAMFKVGERVYTRTLIDPGVSPPDVGEISLGVGRNDGVLRLYTARENDADTVSWEYSFVGDQWTGATTLSASSYASSPVIADLENEGANTLYLGGWNNLGVLYSKYDAGWPAYTVLNGSTNNGNILAMKAGDGRNDGVTRLYVAHYGTSGLIEYSWNGTEYESLQLLNTSVGKFGIGHGRNDGVNRIYALDRGGTALYEFTWNGATQQFESVEIYTAGVASAGTVHVGDGRGDGVQRLYVWAGSVLELTYAGGSWSSLTLDPDSTPARFHITTGTIRADGQPSVYVSVKEQGLEEYTWSDTGDAFTVDAISSATGGVSIGDGRGDGKDRLYVARGTKDHYSEAAVVEISEELVY